LLMIASSEESTIAARWAWGIETHFLDFAGSVFGGLVGFFVQVLGSAKFHTGNE
jgi:hypothetical protein